VDPISFLRAAILGLLQSVSELFAISSLGHSVVMPRLFGWDIHQNDDYFVTFLVAPYFATAIVLFLFFLRDRQRILIGMGRVATSAPPRRSHSFRGSRTRARRWAGPRGRAVQRARARFSFLLATPIIGAAALLKLPELFGPKVRRRSRSTAR